MFRMIVVNSHWMLRGMWAVVWQLIDEYIKTKIVIAGYNDCQKNLLEYVDENVLEQQYGGKKQTFKEPFFPPAF